MATTGTIRGAATYARWSKNFRPVVAPGGTPSQAMSATIKALPHSAVITAQVTGNPKRGKSAVSYDKYGFGEASGATITLAGYIANLAKLGGATAAYGHVAWDVNHGFVTVQGLNGWPSATPAALAQTPVFLPPKETPKPQIDPVAKEAIDHFFEELDVFAEIKRMVTTAMHTVAYANGQSIVVDVKAKDTDFSDREDMEAEIAKLLKKSGYCCALTGYDFRKLSNNPHLKPSLDRKNSGLGYIRGNIQVVTRAANFYKSASDEADWALKAKAMRQMALAMQQRKITSESKKD